jgi:DNA polymerase-3 subunit gamma/tau
VTRIVEALSRQNGAELLAHVHELDHDAPDYDRALIELAAFLQRIAIVQIVPDAAHQDEEFDAEALNRLAQALSPEDVQLYYQIALGGRRDLSMAPDPRVGFEMTLLRMLAFRPEPIAGVAATAGPGPATAALPGVGRPPETPPQTRTPAVAAVSVPASAPPTIDAGNWAAVIDAAGLSGMVRQFALNCVPGTFENAVLHLQVDPAVADRRSRNTEEKLEKSLIAYLGREIKVLYEHAESALITPARRRAMAEQDQALRAAVAFEDDPTVKGLRERFGAEVDLTSVKPLN